MNSWIFTAVVFRLQPISEQGGVKTLHFTAINSEKVFSEDGQELPPDVTPDIDCVWKNPPERLRSEWEKFREGCTVHIKGRPKLRHYTRERDGSQGTSLYCQVFEAYFVEHGNPDNRAHRIRSLKNRRL